MKFKRLMTALQGVCVYRDVLAQPVMERAVGLVESLARGDGPGGLQAYAELFYQLRLAGCAGLGDWLGQALRWSEGPYPRLCEAGRRDPPWSGGPKGTSGPFPSWRRWTAGSGWLGWRGCWAATAGRWPPACPGGTAEPPFPLRA